MLSAKRQRFVIARFDGSNIYLSREIGFYLSAIKNMLFGGQHFGQTHPKSRWMEHGRCGWQLDYVERGYQRHQSPNSNFTYRLRSGITVLGRREWVPATVIVVNVNWTNLFFGYRCCCPSRRIGISTPSSSSGRKRERWLWKQVFIFVDLKKPISHWLILTSDDNEFNNNDFFLPIAHNFCTSLDHYMLVLVGDLNWNGIHLHALGKSSLRNTNRLICFSAQVGRTTSPN